MPNSTTSVRQRLRELKDIDNPAVDDHLRTFAKCWCGFNSEHVLVVLTHTRALSFHDGALSSLNPTTCRLRQRPARALRIAAMDNPELTRSSPMLTAFNRMTATGFRTGPWLLTKETLSGKKPLTLPDFELAFTMWKRLEEDVQSLLSVHFVKYWQSIEGAALTGDVLRKLKALWEHTSPTQSRRLSPARACGLGWTAEETVALLETHVDLNGDTQAGPAPLPPWRYRPLTVLLWTA